MVQRPVYVINGFLDSGKSSFFSYTIAQPYFQTSGTTLLIVCEEGEVEYGERLLRQTNTVMEVFENEEDLTPSAMMALEVKYRPERILIEYNGMWNYKNFRLPRAWRLEQQITVIDASTFSVYFTNMRSLLAEQLRGSELIMFNRCDGIDEKTLVSYKRNVKAINQQADLIFEDSSTTGSGIWTRWSIRTGMTARRSSTQVWSWCRTNSPRDILSPAVWQ